MLGHDLANAGSELGGLGQVIETDTLVVGAGPQALTVLARWLCDRPASVNNVIVADPSGQWMDAWHAAFDRQRIDVLRSPGVHHPDPDEMAFVRALQRPGGAHARCGARKVDAEGPLRRPTAAAFRSFCRDLLQRTGLADRVLPAAVISIRPADDIRSGSHWTAQLSNGARVRARQIVWATNPRIPRLPNGVETCDVIVHSDGVDLDGVAPGQRIAVLGGGQTAGQLALEAARRGAAVTLVNRGRQRIADLDVDAGWLMDDHLVPFRSIADPAERRRVVQGAQHGSMTADLDRALMSAAVCRLCDAGDITARPSGRGAVVGLAGIECEVDAVWLATGSVPDLRATPALAKLAAAGAPHVEGWPILTDGLEWRDGVFIVGALAALTLGPAAGNLGGARAAAELLASRPPR